MTSFPVWQIITFLIIDLVIIASIVAGIFFIVLFIKSRKYKRFKSVDLNELDAFKNKNLKEETDASIRNNLPVAPSTINPSVSFESLDNVYTDVPIRTNSMPDASNMIFNQQMQQNVQQMNDTFAVSQNTNFFNMWGDYVWELILIVIC